MLGYGFGMAATLTAAGLLLIRVRDRFAGRVRSGGRLTRMAEFGHLVPVLTAGLVLFVGLGLATRSLYPLI